MSFQRGVAFGSRHDLTFAVDALDELQAAAENQIEVEVVIEDGNNGTQVGEAQTETQREEATVRQRLLTLIGGKARSARSQRLLC